MVSNTAELFESLFAQFVYLGILVGIVVLAILAILILKFRDRGAATPEPKDGIMLGKIPEERGKIKTIVISLTLSTLVLAFLLNGTFAAIDELNTPPGGTMTIEVQGFQWGWKFIYPNKYEDTVLRVAKEETVILKITSTDVFHSFGIVEFRMKKDAIPGRINTLWFVPKEIGAYDIVCFEFCGLGHAFMKTKLYVMEPNEFQDWYSKLKPRSVEHPIVQEGGQRP